MTRDVGAIDAELELLACVLAAVMEFRVAAVNGSRLRVARCATTGSNGTPRCGTRWTQTVGVYS